MYNEENRPDNIVSCLQCSKEFDTEIENFGVSEDGFAICEECDKKNKKNE